MRHQLRLIICFVLFALLGAACSSNTVVASDDRGSTAEAEQSQESTASDDDGSADQPVDDDAADADSTDEESTDDDSTDDERGERADDTPQTPRELEEAGGFGLGGAEQLNGLVADCEQGNDLACDILFQISAFDSPEEAAALTCGGRSDVEVLFCTDGIVAEAELPSFDITSEGLDDIVTLCETDGDMTACDFLYFRSPIDSTFEEIGGTCGGRVNVAVPDCRTFLTDPE